tara:strand:- start:5542 stop:5799 length:258 start_codon:yes stop_codon:yes gene_type:complete
LNETDEDAVPLQADVFGTDDTAIYAQTLSNTVLALVKYRAETTDERIFCRMQIKRLVDAQVALKQLYVDDEGAGAYSSSSATQTP